MYITTYLNAHFNSFYNCNLFNILSLGRDSCYVWEKLYLVYLFKDFRSASKQRSRSLADKFHVKTHNERRWIDRHHPILSFLFVFWSESKSWFCTTGSLFSSLISVFSASRLIVVLNSTSKHGGRAKVIGNFFFFWLKSDRRLDRCMTWD